MKRSFPVLVALLLIIPASIQAQGWQIKREFTPAHISRSEIAKKGNLFSTVADLTMRDGKEFIIPVTVDKKTLKATFFFASGKTVVLTPEGVETIEGEGYQEYDDIENSVNFLETYIGETCLLNIIAYLVFPYPIDLVFLYFIAITCF